MPKPFSFIAYLLQQGVYFTETLPRATPPDVRAHQGLQVMDAVTGRPVLTEDGRMRSFSYDTIQASVDGADEESLRQEAAAGDADAAVLCVFLDFLAAVRAHFPIDLYEICSSKKGLEDVAAAMGIPVTTLRGRLNGASKMLVQELYLAKLRFPDMDLLSSMQRLAEKSIAR